MNLFMVMMLWSIMNFIMKFILHTVKASEDSKLWTNEKLTIKPRTYSRYCVFLEESRLSNPCLMVENSCASHGREYTCMFTPPQYFCYRVCMTGTCVGGTCHAEDPENKGFNGTAQCR